MAFIKFSDYPRLKRAVAQAKHELQEAKRTAHFGSREDVYADHRLEDIQTLIDLYDESRHGAIYIDSSEMNTIKYFAKD